MRILISEDDLINRKILGKFMEPFGEIVLAADGNEAIAKYHEARDASKPFDLMFLDMIMPHKNGLETLEEIRKYEKEKGLAGKSQVPIIMLTGQGDAVQINYALTLGISDYMLKPIDESKLIRELQRLGLIPDPQDQWT